MENKKAQSLLIGLGGTGSRVVNYVAADLRSRNIPFNDGTICCAVLDTDRNDRDKIDGSGTGVCNIATSKDRKISDYLQDYESRGIRDWCPDTSPTFLETSMLDGAAQMRVKSRIGFLDITSDNTIRELETLIGQLLRQREDAKIRIMLVSSLSGGSGSGMFIQVALWLRRFFSGKNCQITIRGIFMLPDIFVQNSEAIRNSVSETRSQYANAYAALREMNAITKFQTKSSMRILRRLKLDDLFDSDDERCKGSALFDFPFLVDYVNTRGGDLTGISQYERAVARLVYMQIYAPIAGGIYSKEDNLFKDMNNSDEPVFGSCGTSMAVYPTEDVLEYCCLRAAKESVSTGWKRIDNDIAAMQEEERAREKDGERVSTKVDPKGMYVKLFDEYSKVKEKKAGRNRLFSTIANDVKNETFVRGEGGEMISRLSDKVGDFISAIETTVIEPTVTLKGQTSAFKLDDGWRDEEHDIDEYKALVAEKEGEADLIIRSFEKKADEYADEVVRAIFPLDMGDVNPENDTTVYGLLTKKDENGKVRFVHPIAARYLIYKLHSELGRRFDVETAKVNAQNGSDPNGKAISFDNPKTRDAENDPAAYLASYSFWNNKKQFISNFADLYSQFNAQQAGLIEKFEAEILTAAVYSKLRERMEDLIKYIERFFRQLDAVVEKIDAHLVENINKNETNDGKVLFVYASAAAKKRIYDSLSVDVSMSTKGINKSVIDSVYGAVCVERRPSSKDNAAYAGASIGGTFSSAMISAFRDLIRKNDGDVVDLDFYTAVSRENDMEYAAAHKDAEEKDDFDPVTGQDRSALAAVERHDNAMEVYITKLRNMASPMLRYNSSGRNNSGVTDDEGKRVMAQKEITFWGFNPAVAEACSALGDFLGESVEGQQNDAYRKNEFCCYSSIYGIRAGDIPMFNELENGVYYKAYREVIDDMVKRVRRGDVDAYINTPHLDKTWHEFLPYVSTEKQKDDDDKFFRAFWLALAYGKLLINKEGHYVLQRSIGSGYERSEEVLYKDKPIERGSVGRLIDALRVDDSFMIFTSAETEETYKREIEDLVTYVGTKVFRGLTPSNADLNPVTVIVRYNTGRGRDEFVTAEMIESLESLVDGLVQHYDIERNDRQIERAKYRLCRRIYDSTGIVKGREETFSKWTQKFDDLGIKEGAADQD